MLLISSLVFTYSSLVLLSLPLIRLDVLEWESARPLVCARLARNMAFARTKHEYPPSNRHKQTMHKYGYNKCSAQPLLPLGVAVKGHGNVISQGNGQRREGVGGRRISRLGGGAFGAVC